MGLAGFNSKYQKMFQIKQKLYRNLGKAAFFYIFVQRKQPI